MMSDDPHDGHAVPSEREKWDAEQFWHQAELSLRREELESRQGELARSRWTHPLVVVIIGGCLTALFGMLTTYWNNQASQAQETARAEAARILEVVKTGDPDTAAKNLQFLASVGLVTDERVSQKLRDYIINRLPGQGISLPQSNNGPKAAESKSSEAADRAADSADDDRRFYKAVVSTIEQELDHPSERIVLLVASLLRPENNIDHSDRVFALRSLAKVPAAMRCPAYAQNRVTRSHVEGYAASTDSELAEPAKQALAGC
jgi:hypothetical protein